MALSVLGAYRGVLSGPDRSALAGVGLLARLYRSMTPLGTVLLVSQHTGSYALAGVVTAAAVVGAGVAGPAGSRWADQRGERAVLPVNLVLTAASLVALVLCVGAGGPRWTWFAASFAVGATALDFGALARARWTGRLSDHAQRHTALGLEAVLDELAFVVGPALVAGLAAWLGTAWALVLALATALVGGAGLLARPEAAARRSGRRPGGPRSLVPAGVVPLLGVYAGVGLLFASVDVSSVAVATAEGVPAMGGAIVACFAAGSTVSGFLFGPLSAGWGVTRRLLATCLAFGALVQLPALAGDADLLPLVGFVVGLGTAPVLISGMSYIARHAQQHRLTEAMSWPGVAISAGITIGSIATGMVIDAFGPVHGFGVASVGGALVAVTGAVLALRARVGQQT